MDYIFGERIFFILKTIFFTLFKDLQSDRKTHRKKNYHDELTAVVLVELTEEWTDGLPKKLNLLQRPLAILSEVRIPTQTNMGKMWLTWNSKMMPELILFPKTFEWGIVWFRDVGSVLWLGNSHGSRISQTLPRLNRWEWRERYKKKTDEIVRLWG